MTDTTASTSTSDELIRLFLKQYQPYDFKPLDIILAGFSFLVAVLFYVSTMTPSISAGDNGELTTAMYYLGIAHAPGYPLHSLIGKLATFIPIHNVAWRANFFSALCGGLTIYFAVLVYIKLMILVRVPRVHALFSGVLAGIGYMFSETLWSQSIMCEVYTISAIFHPVSFLILFKWLDAVIEHRNDEVAYMGERYLFAYAFIFGVAMAGHSTIVITGIFGGFTIFCGLFLFVFKGRRLNKKQIESGITYVTLLVLMLAIAYGMYYYYIMRLKSDLYQVWRVQAGIIPFILCNIILLITYCYDRYTPGRMDPDNYLQKAFHTVVKMFWIFYLGYFIHIYMFIRSHGNPPINWMGIAEVEGTLQKMGKFFNAIWRKQFGNMGKIPMTGHNVIKQYQLAITVLNGSQFSLPLYGVIGLGLVNVIRRNWLLASILIVALFSYNLLLTPYLSFRFDERSLFFVKVFYIFSYFCLSILLAFGLSFIMEMLAKLFPKQIDKSEGNADVS